MTILSGQSIRERCTNLIPRQVLGGPADYIRVENDDPIFSPFMERTRHNGMTYGCGPAGYDVRIAENLSLVPGDFALASTMERFSMPFDLIGIVHDKSTWVRMGLGVFNTVIEPGWRGFLTLELKNNGNKVLDIEAGTPIAQILLHVLDEPTTRPYSGKYQDQEAGPQPALLE